MSRLHYTRTFYPYSRNVCIFIHTLNVSLFFLLQVLVFFFFFFQAEDGIRDGGRDWSSDVCSSDLLTKTYVLWQLTGLHWFTGFFQNVTITWLAPYQLYLKKKWKHLLLIPFTVPIIQKLPIGWSLRDRKSVV